MSSKSIVYAVSCLAHILCRTDLTFDEVYYIGVLAINEFFHYEGLFSDIAVEFSRPFHIATRCTVFLHCWLPGLGFGRGGPNWDRVARTRMSLRFFGLLYAMIAFFN